MYIPGRMRLLLVAFSPFSRIASRVKNRLYEQGFRKPERAPLPVISVGNIVFGGSGKTPLAMEILKRLIERGRKPALVSRGYRGGWEAKGGVLSDGKRLLGGWREGGDEPYLVARTVPEAGVFVGRDRLASCRKAAELGFDVVVLDDGFQHRRLARDFDIVLFLPEEKSALREPISSLKRADVVLIEAGSRRLEKAKETVRRLGREPMMYSVAARGLFDLAGTMEVSPQELAGRRTIAFCGIARPERFRRELRRLGIEPVSFLTFPDHHSYPRRSLEKIVRAGKETGAEAAVTTEKDAVKLGGAAAAPPLGSLPVYVFRIGLALEAAFEERLNSLLCR